MIWKIVGVIKATAVALCACSFAAGGGTVLYQAYLQPDPEVLACARPYFNAGVDAKGLRPIVTRPGLVLPPTDWRPIEKTTFRYGDEAWVLRDDIFRNKVSGPLQRSFWSDDGLHVYQLPVLYPPKTTPSGQCSRANFLLEWPRFLRPEQKMHPGGYTYKVDVIMRKNMLFEPLFFTPLPPVKLAVIE